MKLFTLCCDPECAIFKLYALCAYCSPCSVSLYEIFTVQQIDICRSANGNSAKVKQLDTGSPIDIKQSKRFVQLNICPYARNVDRICSSLISFFSFLLPSVWNRPALVTYKLWLYIQYMCKSCPIHSIIVLRILIAHGSSHRISNQIIIMANFFIWRTDATY